MEVYNLFKPDQPVGLMDFVRAARSCITKITPKELKAKRDAKEDLLLVDVRESAEFEYGHIGGAHLVPRGIIEAAAVLQLMGFKNVLNPAGGGHLAVATG